MKIGFFCDLGEIPEIGTGHFYRSKWTAEAMERRGHKTVRIGPGDIIPDDLDVLVIDDLRSQRSVLDEAKANGAKIVLIDGIPEDVPGADLTISARFNTASQYIGTEYMSFLPRGDRKYSDPDNRRVFVSMGGFDANEIAYTALDVLDEIGADAVVTKSINHIDLEERFPNAEIYVGDDYYEPMSTCKIGIVAGGLTMFQAFHFGLPCVVVPQYDHQVEYIRPIRGCCFVSLNRSRESIKTWVDWLLSMKDSRLELSDRSQKAVDGKAIDRTCDLIEGMFNG